MRIAGTFFLRLALVFVLAVGTWPAMAAHIAMARDNGAPTASQFAPHAAHPGMGGDIGSLHAPIGDEAEGGNAGDMPDLVVCKTQCTLSGTESLSATCVFRHKTGADQIRADNPLFPRAHVVPPPVHPPKTLA